MLDAMTLVLAQDEVVPPRSPSNEAATSGTTLENADPTQPADGTQNAPGGGGGSQLWLFMLLALVVMWVFMLSSSRREKKKRANLLAAMAKGSKVQTVGGILGTVVEVRDDEVVVKVDENANTRLRFARSAIQSVLETEDKSA